MERAAGRAGSAFNVLPQPDAEGLQNFFQFITMFLKKIVISYIFSNQLRLPVPNPDTHFIGSRQYRGRIDNIHCRPLFFTEFLSYPGQMRTRQFDNFQLSLGKITALPASMNPQPHNISVSFHVKISFNGKMHFRRFQHLLIIICLFPLRLQKNI